MFEEFGGILKKAEQRMAGLTNLETKFEEIERTIKEEGTTKNSSIEKTRSKISEMSKTLENQGEKLT